MADFKILCLFLLVIFIEEDLNVEALGLLPLPGSGNTPTPPLCTSRSSGSTNTSRPQCSFNSIEITTGRAVPGSTYQETPFPAWIDLNLAKIGQAFGRKNRFSISAGALNGLLGGLGFPDARDVLSFTKASDTPETAVKRYTATAVQMFVWFDSILNMDLNNNVFLTSISSVRALHINAANKANSAPKPINDPNKYADIPTDDAMWEAFHADLKSGPDFEKYKNYPAEYSAYDGNATFINQFVQGLTLAGFMGGVVLYPESCFIWNATDLEFRGFLHLWAIIGYAVGVDDEFNICLQPTVEAAKSYLLDLQNKYVLPSLYKIDKPGKVLVEAFIDGFYTNGTLPGQSKHCILLRLLRDFLGVPVTRMTALLSPADSAAMSAWDNVFVPSTKLLATKLALNSGVATQLQANTLGYFGLYFTNMEKAEHVFFPKPGEEEFNSK